MHDPPPPADNEPGGYRVLFTKAHDRGTIVVADADEAHRQARAIARAGGRAQVQYVSTAAAPQTLATYP